MNPKRFPALLLLILGLAAADASARSKGDISYGGPLTTVGHRQPRRALPGGAAPPGAEKEEDKGAAPGVKEAPAPPPHKASPSSSPTPKVPEEKPSEGSTGHEPPKDPGPEKPVSAPSGQGPPPPERPKPKEDPSSESPMGGGSPKKDGPAADEDSPSESPSASSRKSKKGKSNKGKSKKGASKGQGEEEDGDSGPAGGAAEGCDALRESAVRGQVEYTVEIVAATEKDAAAVADDVSDVVVSSLTNSLASEECQRRTKRRLQQQQRSRRQQPEGQRRRRRRLAGAGASENTFLSFSGGGSQVSGDCASSSGSSSDCHVFKSLVNYEVVEGPKGGAADEVIAALAPAFASLPAGEVRLVGARAVEAEDRPSAAGAEGSASSQRASRPGVPAAALAGALVAAALVAAVLYEGLHRRRQRRFRRDLDGAEKDANLADATADESDVAMYVYDDDSQGYESGGEQHRSPARPDGGRRFLPKFRLPRRSKRSRAAPPHDAMFSWDDGDDQSVEVIERTTLKVPPVAPRKYSATIIAPPPEPSPPRSRREWVSSTVDF